MSIFTIDETSRTQIRKVEHYATSRSGQLDVRGTLEFYRKRYVDQLPSFISIDEDTVIADLGTGYGWLAMAFALFTPARVIAVELDSGRLEAAREIAAILGLAERIDWRVGALGSLPLQAQSVDVAYCIEVLEHVQGAESAVEDLARISRDLVILTTPNLWFPVIAHDTRLPFCHWMPNRWRTRYARVFGRADYQFGNLFWSPLKIRRALGGFKVVSSFLHYSSYQDYLATFPYYLPYRGGIYVEQLSCTKALYYRFVSKCGKAAHFILPNLASVFRRAPL